jgi:hypothetical protein
VTPPSASSAATLAPRFAALHTAAYRQYFTLGLIAMTADNIEHVISYWVIYQAFHSPTLGGFAVISHWMPFLLFSVYTGALADRHDCRKLIAAGVGLFINIAFTSMAQTLVQLLAPARVRGSIVGLYNTAVLGLRAGSGVTVGVLGAVISVEWSLALSALVVVLIATGLYVLEARRREPIPSHRLAE